MPTTYGKGRHMVALGLEPRTSSTHREASRRELGGVIGAATTTR
jgi:hypothetical protein